MKLVAVLGSPHPNGPSSTLSKEVIRGAKEAGWECCAVRNRIHARAGLSRVPDLQTKGDRLHPAG